MLSKPKEHDEHYVYHKIKISSNIDIGNHNDNAIKQLYQKYHVSNIINNNDTSKHNTKAINITYTSWTSSF